MFFRLLIIAEILFLLFDSNKINAQPCDKSTPSYIANLTGKPDCTWISPQTVRTGLCCGLDPNANPPIRCVEFMLTLDTGASGIRLEIASGAVPSGSLGYQIWCGQYYMVGENICLTGPGPHRITFCKPGNNPNTYAIVSIPKPKVSPPVTVSDGCSATLFAEGFQPASIKWTSIPYNATYNSYLSCTSGCTTVTATYKTGAPAYVDYEVSGNPIGGCSTLTYKRVTRVFFVNDKKAQILPKDPTICYGGTSATLTAYGSGGAPPYNYKWSTGATTQSITVGAGKYWVEIKDTTSCPAARDSVTVTAFNSPIVANAGPDKFSCTNNPSASFNGTVQIATGGIWSGGNGTFSPSNISLSMTYTPTATEIANGKVMLFLTTTGNASCPPSKDTVLLTITPAPVINAGTDKTICFNNSETSLNASVQFAGGVVWSGGNGIFKTSNSILNPTYVPTSTEITSGQITLTATTTNNGLCLPVSDDVIIKFTPAPTIDAGPDISVCANNSSAKLSSTITIAGGVNWSGGAGNFLPDRNSISPTYIPTASEISNGSVNLTATTTSNGNCSPVSDNIVISITPAPTVDAGPDATVCANNSSAVLSGTVTVATGGTWSGGSGTLTAANSTLLNTYLPSGTEITQGKVILILTTTGNGNCLPVSDEKIIFITPAPIVNAGPDQSICANNAFATLSGTVQNATGITWSGSTGTFSPGTNSLSPKYSATAQDITTGTVILTATSTGNGNCLPVSDDIKMTITPAPTIGAGPDVTVCANTTGIALSGTVTTSTGVMWSTAGSGTFVNANNLTTIYTPSPADITAGFVNLKITSTGNGNCIPVTAQKKITLSPIPAVDAGPDKTICADGPGASLTGNYSNAGGIIWSTSGTGNFTPSNTNLSTSYNVSTGDRASGAVTITLTTSGNGVCSAVSDQMKIFITNSPTISAGPDILKCADAPEANLSVNFSVGTGVTWTSTGTGTFLPNAQSSTPQYAPTAADITSGKVTITVVTTGNGKCIAVSDNVDIKWTPAPIINAGPDLTICSDNTGFALNATITNATGVTWSGGTGIFNPVSALNTNYEPGNADLNSTQFKLTATSTGNGLCKPVKDELIVFVNPAASADAGPDQNVCGKTTGVQILGYTTNSTSAVWSTSGTGSFAPSASTLNATYVPSSSDTTAGTVFLILTSAGLNQCSSVQDSSKIYFSKVPIISAGADQNICESKMPVKLYASGTPSKWSGGTGTFTPNDSAMNAAYIPSPAELATGFVNLTVTTIINEACPAETDNVRIDFTKTAVIIAGADKTICADSTYVPLSVTLTNAAGIKWMSAGNGTFSPDIFTNTITYYPTASEINSGEALLTISSTGTSVCDPVTEDIKIVITPKPTVNAGSDQTLCADTDQIKLNGSFTNAGGIIWKSSGNGSFVTSDTNVLADYKISSADTANGKVSFIITTINNGLCKSVSDTVNALFQHVPILTIPTDITVCKDSDTIQLTARVYNASGLEWSSNGSGEFAPSPFSLLTSYSPKTQEKNSGATKIFIQSTGNGICNATKDSLKINYTTTPIVDAGNDIIICSDSSYIDLSATVTVSSGGQWSTTGSGNFSNSSSLNTRYFISANDSAIGMITFNIITTGNGKCKAVSDQITVTLSPAPSIDAGSDQIICADNRTVSLSGLVSVAGGIKWSSSGFGSFSDSLNTTTNYFVSDQDTAIRNVVFYAMTTQNGNCKSYIDSIALQITPAPIVNTPSLITLCKDVSSINLTGNVFNASGVKWTSAGSGSFANNGNTSTDTYTLSAADKSKNNLIISLTSTGNGLCNPVRDSIEIIFTPAPVAGAGNDQKVCASEDSIGLSGAITVATGGKWTTSGSGIFSPSDSLLNAYYIPSSADTASGSVSLILSSTGNGTCIPVKDTSMITFIAVPVIIPAPDFSVCANTNTINITTRVYNAAAVQWSTTGNGELNNENQLQANYILHTQDRSKDSIAFLITSTGNNFCAPASDTLNVFIQQQPVLTSLIDQTCIDSSGIQVNAKVMNAQGLKWTSTGNGQFLPDQISDSIIYKPGTTDFSNGRSYLKVTSTGNGVCTAAMDSIDLVVRPAAVAIAGNDQQICSNVSTINLQGTLKNSNGGSWTTTGTGNFTPDNITPTASYIPSNEDLTNDAIALVFTTTGNGLCPESDDTLNVFIAKLPQIDAGPDFTICPKTDSLKLTASSFNESGIKWTTYGFGNFSIDNSISTAYIPDRKDINAKRIKLTVSALGKQGCPDFADTVIITVLPLPIADAGIDQAICVDADAVAFTATITEAPGVTWTSDGTGSFSDNSALITKYFPSADDKSKGSVMLHISTILGNTCIQKTDSALLLLKPVPLAFAGQDNIVCEDTDTINISGSVTNAKIGTWTTTGNGIIHADTLLKGYYLIANTDKISGNAILILTSANEGCSNSDSVNIKIYPSPQIGLANTPSCNGDKVTLTAKPLNIQDDHDFTYQWMIGNVVIAKNTSTIQVDSNGTYIAEIKAGSCTRYDSSTVTFYGPPTTNASPPIPFCKELQSTVPIDAGDGDHYLWLNNQFGQRVQVVDEPGEYLVKVFNKYNCSSIDTVIVYDICPPKIFVPTIFTPNKDGQNDQFQIFGKYFTNFKLTIFNRWGEIIFYTEDPSVLWDGTYLGKEMQNGVYAWIITYEGLTDTYRGPYQVEGSVTIDR